MSLLCWIIKILICADVNDPHRFRLVKVCRESIIVLPRRSSHRFKVLIVVVIFTGKVDAEEEATEKGNEAKRMMLFKMMFEGLIMWYYNIHKRALNGCKVLKFFRFSSFFFSMSVFCVGKQRKNFSLNFFARLMVNSSLFSSCSIFFPELWVLNSKLELFIFIEWENERYKFHFGNFSMIENVRRISKILLERTLNFLFFSGGNAMKIAFRKYLLRFWKRRPGEMMITNFQLSAINSDLILSCELASQFLILTSAGFPFTLLLLLLQLGKEREKWDPGEIDNCDLLWFLAYLTSHCLLNVVHWKFPYSLSNATFSFALCCKKVRGFIIYS